MDIESVAINCALSDIIIVLIFIIILLSLCDCSLGKKTGQDSSLGKKTGQDSSLGKKTGQDSSLGKKTGQDSSLGKKTGQDSKVFDHNNIRVSTWVCWCSLICIKTPHVGLLIQVVF